MMDWAEDVQALIRPGERLDDLQRETLKILQKPEGFCFGMDSVLLASFAAARTRKGRAIDLGTGSGVLPLLIGARVPSLCFDAVEIQPDMADMAARTMRLNGMEEKICVHAMDLRDAPRQLGYEHYDLVVSNPPYGQAGGSLTNPAYARKTARHEGDTEIGDIAAAAGALLRNGGRFAVVFPAPRMLALMDAMRKARIEPKHLQMVHPAYEAPPNLVLLEGIKAAKPLLQFMPPLFIRDGHGNETQQLKAMYES